MRPIARPCLEYLIILGDITQVMRGQDQERDRAARRRPSMPDGGERAGSHRVRLLATLNHALARLLSDASDFPRGRVIAGYQKTLDTSRLRPQILAVELFN